MINIPAHRICSRVGLARPKAYSRHTFFSISYENTPTPSEKTRPFLSMSEQLVNNVHYAGYTYEPGTTWTAPGLNLTVPFVSEKACPILAAHFAGDRMLEKSPSRATTPRALSDSNS